MRRRTFLLCLAARALGRGACAAEPGILPLVGFLNSGSPESFAPMVSAFLDGLREVGLEPGRDVQLDYEWANGVYGRLPELASALAARNVTVIAATGGEVSALAAKAATSSIPVVFTTGVDPVERGLVTSVNRPEANLTGVVQFTFALDAKRFGLLGELMPSAKIVGALINPARPSADKKRADLEDAARKSERRLLIVEARQDADFEGAFATVMHRGAGALLVASDPFFFDRRERIVALAGKHRIPAIYEWRDFPQAGGLMSYGANLADGYRQVGVYVGRIVNGARPADLPVIQSTTFELVINMKVANALGLAVPLTLLAQATEVIE
jgi:putative tryptophan/tyrosine transport system substrate-binding protein